MKPIFTFFLTIVLSLPVLLRAEEVLPLKIMGAEAVNEVVANAAQALRAERHMQIQISTAGSENAGFAELGQGKVDIAMMIRPLTLKDKSAFPDVQFSQTYIGDQVLVIIVSKEIWNSGVHVLSKEYVRAIYEGKVTNWKQIGGPDIPITFYVGQEGFGNWEMLVMWLYGDGAKAPMSDWPSVRNEAEAVNSVQYTPGGISLVSPKRVDSKNVFALATGAISDRPWTPGIDNLISRKYPLQRPMYLVVRNHPVGQAKVLIDFMLGVKGSEILSKCGYYPFSEYLQANPLLEPPQ